MKSGFKFYEDEWTWYRLKTEEELHREFGMFWRDEVKWPILLDEYFGDDLEDFIDGEYEITNRKAANGAMTAEVYDDDTDERREVVITGDMVVRSENYDENVSEYCNENYEDDSHSAECENLGSIAKELQQTAKPAASLKDVTMSLQAEASVQKPVAAADFSDIASELANEAKPAGRTQLIPPSDSPVAIAKDLSKQAVTETIKGHSRKMPDLDGIKPNYTCSFSEKGLLRR